MYENEREERESVRERERETERRSEIITKELELEDTILSLG